MVWNPKDHRWRTVMGRSFNGEHDPLTSGFGRYPGTLFWEFQTHPLIRGYPGILQPLTPPVCHWLAYGWILCVCYRRNAATPPQPWLTSDSTSGLPVAFRSLAQPGSAGQPMLWYAIAKSSGCQLWGGRRPLKRQMEASRLAACSEHVPPQPWPWCCYSHSRFVASRGAAA